MVCCLECIILTFWTWSLGCFHSDDRRVETTQLHFNTGYFWPANNESKSCRSWDLHLDWLGLTLRTRECTRVILKVFSVMFSARTALDYREQCFGGQAQSLIIARCWTWRKRLLVSPSYCMVCVIWCRFVEKDAGRPTNWRPYGSTRPGPTCRTWIGATIEAPPPRLASSEIALRQSSKFSGHNMCCASKMSV